MNFFPGKIQLLRKIKMYLSNSQMDSPLFLLLSQTISHQFMDQVINQGRIEEFWKGGLLRITDERGPTMVGGYVPENFEN